MELDESVLPQTPPQTPSVHGDSSNMSDDRDTPSNENTDDDDNKLMINTTPPPATEENSSNDSIVEIKPLALISSNDNNANLNETNTDPDSIASTSAAAISAAITVVSADNILENNQQQKQEPVTSPSQSPSPASAPAAKSSQQKQEEAEEGGEDEEEIILSQTSPPSSPSRRNAVNRNDEKDDHKWHTVGIFENTSATINSYIDNSVWSSSGLEFNSKQLPDLNQFERLNLEPGSTYRFRLRAINSMGASEWSEPASFKTCMPGFPGAPSAIKITKSTEGANLTWEPPPTCIDASEIMEYSVYLAVKYNRERDVKLGLPPRPPNHLAFVRVFVGATNECTVTHATLASAYIDCSNKPAIIFRIAARNEKGYGPATQVRWLQELQALPDSPEYSDLSSIKNTKTDPAPIGASPSKRFKANT